MSNMRKICVVKLGTVTRDKATTLPGTLTHWVCNMGGKVTYYFQPRGVDKKGQPIDKILLEEARLEVIPSDLEEVEVPFEILGTQVTDKASGFTGMATSFIRHINGCFHVFIQPAGKTEGGEPIRHCNFDLRECEGEKITQMNETALKESRRDTPSPVGFPTESTALRGANVLNSGS